MPAGGGDTTTSSTYHAGQVLSKARETPCQSRAQPIDVHIGQIDRNIAPSSGPSGSSIFCERSSGVTPFQSPRRAYHPSDFVQANKIIESHRQWHLCPLAC